jgi:hypothetical protein
LLREVKIVILVNLYTNVTTILPAYNVSTHISPQLKYKKRMKRLYVIVLLLFICSTGLLAQNNDLLLARQYATNGEQQKALDIYQKAV